jgi:hypothetical protein
MPGYADLDRFLLRILFNGDGAGGERGPDLVPVDGLGDRRAAVTDQVADVLDADTVGGQDGHERVPQFPWRPRLPRPAALVMTANSRRTCQRSSGLPSSQQKTRPWSCQCSPAWSRSAARRLRCSRCGHPGRCAAARAVPRRSGRPHGHGSSRSRTAAVPRAGGPASRRCGCDPGRAGPRPTGPPRHPARAARARYGP